MKEVNKIILTQKEVRDIISRYTETHFGRSLPEVIKLSVEDGSLQIEYTSEIVAMPDKSTSWNLR